MFRCWIVTQGLPYGKSRCEHCWRKPIIRMHSVFLQGGVLGIMAVGIMDAILLQLFEEHNSVIKKKKGMEEVIIKPVGSQHIHYSLHSVLLLCMWRFCFDIHVRDENQLRCKKEIDLFLLDTTTFSAIKFQVQFSCLCSFKRGLLQSWNSVAC